MHACLWCLPSSKQHLYLARYTRQKWESCYPPPFWSHTSPVLRPSSKTSWTSPWNIPWLYFLTSSQGHHHLLPAPVWQPPNWSPHSHSEATLIFSGPRNGDCLKSNLDQCMLLLYNSTTTTLYNIVPFLYNKSLYCFLHLTKSKPLPSVYKKQHDLALITSLTPFPAIFPHTWLRPK